MRCSLLLALLFGSMAAQAEEPPRRPNLVLVTIAGLDGVGAPAWGLDTILPDPEVRARVTPNLTRLAAMGARFEHAYGGQTAFDRAWGSGIGYAADAGYSVSSKPPTVSAVATHRADRIALLSAGEGAVRNWERLTPTTGRGRRSEEDLSVEAWERLVESQASQQHAALAAERVSSHEGGAPGLVVCQLDPGTPRQVAGVFFDRFPLDQIVLPTDDYALRTLAGRMNLPGDEAAALAADPDGERAWKAAIQAWLANASALDYAAGKIVDAVEAANTDDNPANDWAIVLAAPPTTVGVGELASRSDLLLAIPGVTEPGQQIATPVSLEQAGATIATLVGAKGRESLLPLLARAGERYDAVAITAAGDSLGARSHRFRLVHRTDSTQSLYNLAQDPAGLVDLLDPNYEASIKGFGLSPTQVESVRKWLGWKLLQRLEEPAQVGTGVDPETAAASLKKAGVFEPPAGYTAPMPGDFNRDGVVDAADKTLFRDTQGDEVPVGAGADADHDGRIGDADGEIWRANYGRRAPAANP